MFKRDRMLSRKFVVGFAALMMLSIGAMSANAGPVDDVSKFAAQAKSEGGAAPEISSAAIAPVKKFSLTGRVTESLGAGGCLNNPLTSSCSSADCDNVTMSGPVSATGVGKSTLSACYTIFFSSSSGVCYNGLGIGTLTAANGSLVNIAFGGDFCVADEKTPTVTIYFTSDLSYVIEGGTGPFATEAGTGNMAVSDIIVNPGSLPYAGTGQVAMTGTFSKN